MSDNQSTYSALLKNVYPDDRVENLIYNKNRFLEMVEKDEGFLGVAYPHAVVYGGAQGINNTFTKAQTQSQATSTQAAQFNINSRGAFYGVATWARETMLASSADVGAFLNVAKINVENAIRQIGNQLSDAVYRSGYGDIGNVGTGTTLGSTVLQLAVPQDVVHFEVGMQLDVASTQTAAVRAYGSSGNPLIITKIDRSAGTLTFGFNLNDATNGIPTIAAGDFVFVAGNHATTTTLPIGIEGWIPSSAPGGSDSFWGVNRSVDSRLYGNRLSAVDGRPLEETLNDAAYQVALNDGAVDHFFMSFGNYNKLIKQLGSKVQYIDMNRDDADVGFRGVRLQTVVGEAICIPDRSCPPNRVYGLELDSWKLASLKKLVNVVDEDGLVIVRGSNASTFETRYESYSQLVCKAPSHNINVQVQAF